MFLFLFGGVGLLTGGLIAGVVVAAATIATAVATLGGIGPAIDEIKAKLADWTGPLREGFSAVVTITTLLVQHFGEINEALAPVRENIVNSFLELGQAAVDYVSKNAGMVAGILGTIATLGVLYFTLSTLNVVLTALGVRWLIVNAAVLTLRATIIVYNATLVATKLIMGALTLVAGFITGSLALVKAVITGIVATLIALNAMLTTTTIGTKVGALAFVVYKVILALVSVAIWGVNASLAVMQGLLSIIAVIVTGGIVATGFIVLAAAVMAVYETSKNLFAILSGLDLTVGPINHITGLFRQWYPILQQVVRVAQFDMPAAWVLLQVGFELVISQMRDLLPPLWNFIREGFTIVWNYISLEFKLSFNDSLQYLLKKITGLPSIFTFLSPGIVGAAHVGLKYLRDEVEGIVSGADAAAAGGEKAAAAHKKALVDMTKEEFKAYKFRYEQAQKAQKALADLLSSFKADESAATKAKRETLEDLLIEMANLKPDEVIPPEAKDTIETAFEKLGEGSGKAMVDGLKSQIGKFDTALLASAEAISRLEAYRDITEFGRKATKVPTVAGGPAGEGGRKFDVAGLSSAEAITRKDDLIQVQKEMLEILKARLPKPKPGDVKVDIAGPV
jgi:hypothetical protein